MIQQFAFLYSPGTLTAALHACVESIETLYNPINKDSGSEKQKVYNKYHTVQNVCDFKKVQVGNDQEKAQSEKDVYSKNRGGQKQTNNKVLIP